MMRKLTLTGVLAISLIAVGARAQPMGPHPAPSGSMDAGGAMPTPDYMRAAAQGDEFEITTAKMALSHSQNSRIDAFAQRMIRDHAKSTHLIHVALRDSGHIIPPPPPLSPQQQQMVDELRSSGPNFDRTYVNQMVQSHEMALSVHQGYAQGGTDPKLRHAAAMIAPVVQSHLQMAQAMQSRMD